MTKKLTFKKIEYQGKHNIESVRSLSVLVMSRFTTLNTFSCSVKLISVSNIEILLSLKFDIHPFRNKKVRSLFIWFGHGRYW